MEAGEGGGDPEGAHGRLRAPLSIARAGELDAPGMSGEVEGGWGVRSAGKKQAPCHGIRGLAWPLASGSPRCEDAPVHFGPEAVSNQPPAPFSADTLPQLCAAIFTGTPTPLRAVRPEVPEGLAVVLEKAYARDRTSRYPSV